MRIVELKPNISHSLTLPITPKHPHQTQLTKYYPHDIAHMKITYMQPHTHMKIAHMTSTQIYDIDLLTYNDLVFTKSDIDIVQCTEIVKYAHIISQSFVAPFMFVLSVLSICYKKLIFIQEKKDQHKE